MAGGDAAPAPPFAGSGSAGGRQPSPGGGGRPGAGKGNDRGRDPNPKPKGGKSKGGGKGGGRPGSQGSQGSGKRPGSRPSSKGSGKGRTPLTKEQKKKLPCAYFNTGGCKKPADECEWAHRTATAEEKKRFPARLMKGRSPSPVPKKKICAAFAKHGKCPYGNNCKFSHDLRSSSPSPKSPKGQGA